MVDAGHIVALCVLALVVVLTAYYELKEGRIPNGITTPALVAGFVIGYLDMGVTLRSSVGGFLVGFCFLFVFYMFGGMGGGDVKLMGAVGALLGFPEILPVLMYTAFIGGAMAFVVLIWSRQFWQGLSRSLGMMFAWKRGPRLDDGEGDEAGEEAKPLTVPYGLAIVTGCLLHVLLQAGRFPG